MSEDAKASPPAPKPPKRRPGRPNGVPNTKTILKKLAAQKHSATLNGRTVTVNTITLLLLNLRNQAMSGNLTADKYLERLEDRYGPSIGQGGYLVAPATATEEEWVTMIEAHNAQLAAEEAEKARR